MIFFRFILTAGAGPAWLLAALLLAGCAAAPPPLPDVSPEQALEARLKRLRELQSWTLTGRVGANNGKDSLSASMRWIQTRERYRIRLSGPLGQGLVEVTGSEAGVALRNAERQTFYASTPEVLLSERFGWRLPVSGLRYWILGQPVPGAAVERRRLDAYGRLTRLDQSGWRIEYLEYEDVGGMELPSRINLEHRELKARIAVRHWQLES